MPTKRKSDEDALILSEPEAIHHAPFTEAGCNRYHIITLKNPFTQGLGSLREKSDWISGIGRNFFSPLDGGSKMGGTKAARTRDGQLGD